MIPAKSAAMLMFALLLTTHVFLGDASKAPYTHEQLESIVPYSEHAVENKIIEIINENQDYRPVYSSPWGNDRYVRFSHPLFPEDNEEIFPDAFIGAIATHWLKNSESIASDSFHGKTQNYRRKLVAGDFDELNQILKETVIQIPDIDIELDAISASIRSFFCYGINIGDVNVAHNFTSDQNMTLDFLLEDLGISCEFEWNFKVQLGFFPIRGSGDGLIVSSGSDIEGAIEFYSVDFKEHAPTGSILKSCNATINIQNVSLNGAFAGILEGVLMNNVDTFPGLICGLLDNLVSTTLSNVLSNVSEILNQFSVPLLPGVGDPLSSQEGLDILEDVKLVNLLDIGNGTIGGSAVSVLEKLIGFIGSMTDDPMGPNANTTGQDLVINTIIRSRLLDENRAYFIPVDDLLPKGGVFYQGHDNLTETNITLMSINVLGLDTFTQLNPLNVIAPQTVQSQIQLTELEFQINLKFEIRPSTQPGSFIAESNTTQLVEYVNVKFGVEDLSASLSLLIALEKRKFGDIQLGSMLHLDKMLSCMVSSIYALDISQLDLSFGGIKSPTMDGFITTGIDRIITSTTEAVVDMYESALKKALPIVTNGVIRGTINSMLKGLGNYECAIESENKGTFLDFRDLLMKADDAAAFGASGNSTYGKIVPTLKNLLNRFMTSLDPDSGTSNINKLVIRPITSFLSKGEGALNFPGPIVDTETEVTIEKFMIKFSFRIGDMFIRNMDTVGFPLELLEPTRKRVILNNTISIGTSENPLNVGARMLIALEGDSFQFRNEIDMSMFLIDAKAIASLLAKIDEYAFLTFPLQDASNINCWLATIPARTSAELTLALDQLKISIGKATLRLDCVSCSTPALTKLSEYFATEREIDGNTANDGLNEIIDLASGFLQTEYVQNFIDRFLLNAPYKCPHHTLYGQEAPEYFRAELPASSDASTGFMKIVGITALVVIVFVVAVLVLCRWVVRANNRRWLKSLPHDEIFHLHQEQMRIESQEKALTDMTESMMKSTIVPLWVRISMPIIILGNIALFLSGHLSEAAVVNVYAQVGGQDVTITRLNTFSMAKSFEDLWTVGAKGMAILIIIFSVIWPYTKQLMTLVLWIMPPSKVSVSTRGSVFIWLDKLAKWSMMDIFFLIVSLVAFRIQGSSFDLLPDGFFTFDLMIIPVWGLYSNLIAQLVSQISSHFIIFYHRQVVTDGLKKAHQAPVEVPNTSDGAFSGILEQEQLQEKEVLRDHIFEPNGYREGQRLEVRGGISASLMISYVMVMGLVVAGCVLPSMSFEIEGVLGILVESGQNFQQAINRFSIFSIVRLLMDQARFLSVPAYSLGLGLLSALLILSTFIVPLMQCALLMWIWLSPMTKQLRERALVGVDILEAWQYIEVYIISTLFGSWRVGMLSSFLLNDGCDSLNSIFASLYSYGIISTENARCLYIQGSTEGALFILIAATAVLVVLTHFVKKAATQMIYDTNAQRKEKCRNAIAGIDSSEDNKPDKDISIEDINPPPMQFTNYYSYLLGKSVKSQENLSPSAPDIPESAVETGVAPNFEEK